MSKFKIQYFSIILFLLNLCFLSFIYSNTYSSSTGPYKVNLSQNNLNNLISLHGNASLTDSNTNSINKSIILTENKANQHGAISLNAPIDLQKTAFLDFGVRISADKKQSLGDGIGFVFFPIYHPGDNKQLPDVFGRNDDGTPVKDKSDQWNGQLLQSLGLKGAYFGIGDLMDAIGFKIDTHYNDPTEFTSDRALDMNYHYGSDHYHNKIYGQADLTPGGVGQDSGNNNDGNNNDDDSDDDDSDDDDSKNNYLEGNFVNTSHNGFMYNSSGFQSLKKLVSSGSQPMYDLQIIINESSIVINLVNPINQNGLTWRHSFDNKEASFIKNHEWGFSISASTEQDIMESNTLEVRDNSYFWTLNPLTIVSYIDEDGKNLTMPKIITQPEWQKKHPKTDDYNDSDNTNTRPKQVFQNFNNGEYHLAYVNNFQNINGNQMIKGRRLVNLLPNNNDSDIVKDDDNNIIGINRLPFNEVQNLQYVYRRNIQNDYNRNRTTFKLSAFITNITKKKTQITDTNNKIFAGEKIQITSTIQLPLSITNQLKLAFTLPPGFSKPSESDDVYYDKNNKVVYVNYVIQNDRTMTANVNLKYTENDRPLNDGAIDYKLHAYLVNSSFYMRNDKGDSFINGSYFMDNNNKETTSIFPSSDKNANGDNIPELGVAHQLPVSKDIKLSLEPNNNWWKIKDKTLYIYDHTISFRNPDSSDDIKKLWPWKKDPNITSVQKVIITNTKKKTKVNSTAYMFADMHNLKSITGMENLITSNCTNFTGMFREDENLETLDLTYLNMTKAQQKDMFMKDMFTGDTNLWEITLGDKVKINDNDFPPAPGTEKKSIPFPSNNNYTSRSPYWVKVTKDAENNKDNKDKDAFFETLYAKYANNTHLTKFPSKSLDKTLAGTWVWQVFPKGNLALQLYPTSIDYGLIISQTSHGLHKAKNIEYNDIKDIQYLPHHRSEPWFGVLDDRYRPKNIKRNWRLLAQQTPFKNTDTKEENDDLYLMCKIDNDDGGKLTSILSKDPVLLFDSSSNRSYANAANVWNTGWSLYWIEDMRLMVSNKAHPQPGKYKTTITYSLINAPN